MKRINLSSVDEGMASNTMLLTRWI